MNVFSNALDGVGRWYVAATFLIVMFLAALLLVTAVGQARLREAGERLESSTARQLRIDDLESALAQAVDAQRSFLLTGDKSYLVLYEKYRADIEPCLERLRLAYVDVKERGADIRNLQILTAKRLADLGMVMGLRQSQGTAAAISLIETRVGSDTGLAVTDILEQMRGREAAEHARAAQQWYGSLSSNRWITVAGMLVNTLLVIFATRLIHAAIRRRNSLNAERRDVELHLEQEVSSRTRELVELSTHLQDRAEREKASLARELHDELGGLLVGARMDISWAEQHLARNDPDLKLRLNRVQQNLSAGVDLKRRIIEELRPTLLDNVGLIAALRWLLKETCAKAHLHCSESYPEEEPRFDPAAAIALFRIAQEALTNVVKHASARNISLCLDIDDTTLEMRIVDDGAGMPAGSPQAIDSHGLASMRHRARALGGKVDIRGGEGGGTAVTVQIPVAIAVLHPLEQAIS